MLFVEAKLKIVLYRTYHQFRTKFHNHLQEIKQQYELRKATLYLKSLHLIPYQCLDLDILDMLRSNHIPQYYYSNIQLWSHCLISAQHIVLVWLA